ncbi:MAG: helix-turn-helix domain-containing protein [Oscillospiraceae bacterium]|nr:helix-turn-helix domain-containing protein [Oscillospiraceae bacterium]
MNTRKAIVNRIKELCKERKMNIHALSLISAIPPTTLWNIINGKSKNPGIVTIKILCDGLDITLAEFFDTEEFNSLEQEIR